MSFKRVDAIILAIILIIAFTVRLYKIDTPLADWHSWRQVDTAAVARNYMRDGIDLFQPKFDDLSDVPSGLPNPEGHRFVEFPVYNAAIALITKSVPQAQLVIVGRLISISFSLITIAILFYLLRKEASRTAAVGAGLMFAVFPFFVYYSRVVLPEMTALGMIMLSIFTLYQWKHVKKKKLKYLFLGFSLVFAALSILIKPTAGFYFIPLGFIFLSVYRTKIIQNPIFYAYFILAVIPFFLWREYISQFPEGIPAYTWLLTTVNTFEGPKVIFFRPAFFRWIFYERLLLLILGGYGMVFMIAGMIKKQKNLFLHAFGIAALVYLFTFQGGNVQHDYYQTMILPAVAIYSGLGMSFLLSKKDIFASRLFNALIIAGIFVFSVAMSYETVKGYYGYSESLVNIGNVIQTITPPDAKIVTDREGDTTLLYLADRKGFPSVFQPLEELKAQGMEYFVTGKSDVAESVAEEYELIFEGEDVFIFKL